MMALPKVRGGLGDSQDHHAGKELPPRHAPQRDLGPAEAKGEMGELLHQLRPLGEGQGDPISQEN